MEEEVTQRQRVLRMRRERTSFICGCLELCADDGALVLAESPSSGGSEEEIPGKVSEQKSQSHSGTIIFTSATGKG